MHLYNFLICNVPENVLEPIHQYKDKLTFRYSGGLRKHPTPGGVPVNIKSAGFKVINLKGIISLITVLNYVIRKIVFF